MTKKPPQHPLCPLGGFKCRHCSQETSYHYHTKLKKVNGVFAAAGTGYLPRALGEWCNCDGTHFIADMHYCPVVEDRAKKEAVVVKKAVAISGQQRLMV